MLISATFYTQSFNQYLQAYANRAAQLGTDPNHDDTTFFDAVWVYALALNKTLQGDGAIRSQSSFEIECIVI